MCNTQCQLPSFLLDAGLFTSIPFFPFGCRLIYFSFPLFFWMQAYLLVCLPLHKTKVYFCIHISGQPVPIFECFIYFILPSLTLSALKKFLGASRDSFRKKCRFLKIYRFKTSLVIRVLKQTQFIFDHKTI